MNPKLKKERTAYKNTPIPPELQQMVRKELGTKKKNYRPYWMSAAIAAAIIALFVTLNTNASVARAMGGMPVVGHVFQAMTFQYEDEQYAADIKTPKVRDLENKDVEQTLNEKYEKEAKEQYTKFEQRMKALKGEGHASVTSDYRVLQDTKQLLVIERETTETEASSATTLQYDVVDPTLKQVITLPSLFKNKDYVQVISDEIKQQMKKQMVDSKGEKVYFIKGMNSESTDGFDQIQANQSFYINKKHELVISFNEYEVAPGSMGPVKFVIPTKAIQSLLVSNQYIR